MRHRTLPLLLLTTLLLIAPVSVPIISAQAETQTPAVFELTAVPPRLEIEAKPGETIQKTIKVKNPTGTTKQLTTVIEDFIVESDGTTPIPVTETLENRFSLATWVTISPTQFSLGPNQTQTLDVLIQVPPDAAPGGRYAMALYEVARGGMLTTGTISETNTATGISPRVGSLLYVTIAGPVAEDAFFRQIQAPRFLEYGPVPFSFFLENRSDIHIRPQIGIEIYDMLGRKVETIKVEDKNIFPYTAREYQATYDRYWGFGQYTAKFVAAYGTTGNVARASVTFFILPYTVIIAVLLAVLSLVAIWIAIKRHQAHRRDDTTHELELLRQRVQELEKTKLR